MSGKTVLNDGDSGSTIRAALNAMLTELYGALPFRATATLTSALAATPVHLVPAASVPAGKKVYLTGFLLFVNGAVSWIDATATLVKLQDTATVPVVAATFAKAGLTGNAQIDPPSASVVRAAPVLLGAGLTDAKGLDLVADGNFASGSDIVVTVTGYIA
jgi:hypothetical protein